MILSLCQMNTVFCTAKQYSNDWNEEGREGRGGETNIHGADRKNES